MIVITVARKPMEDAYARHCPKWGTGGINIDASRIPISPTDPEPNTSRRRGDQNIATTYNDHGWKGAGQWSEGSPLGRWPTNLILCPEAAKELDVQSGQIPPSLRQGNRTSRQKGAVAFHKERGVALDQEGLGYTDSGGASRFFKVLRVEDEDLSKGA